MDDRSRVDEGAAGFDWIVDGAWTPVVGRVMLWSAHLLRDRRGNARHVLPAECGLYVSREDGSLVREDDGRPLDLSSPPDGASLSAFTPRRSAIYAVVDDEREYQDALWGGPEHDRQHPIEDWLNLVDRSVHKARCALRVPRDARWDAPAGGRSRSRSTTTAAASGTWRT